MALSNMERMLGCGLALMVLINCNYIATIDLDLREKRPWLYHSSYVYTCTYSSIGGYNAILTIVPEIQYVYLNDTVTLDCATNMTGYVINFFYGTKVLADETVLSNGVKRTTFTATSTINGTDIFCSASMDMQKIFTGLAYFYIQGNLTHKLLC